MAKATRTIEKRLKTVEDTVPIVKLTLEADEAAALVTVLRNVGGDRYKSGRQHTDKVLNALQIAGVVGGAGTMDGLLYWGKKPSLFGDTLTSKSYVSGVSW